MFIRGIDPSRRNVIVGGGGAEGASPLGALQELQRRDMLVARVLSVVGSEATLDVEGRRLVVESHVTLTAGDKLYVRVQEAPGRGLKLSLLANEPADGRSPELADAAVDDLLMALGVPVSERTRAAARALSARDGALTRASLQAFFDALQSFPRLGARAYGQAALLHKLGVPLSASSLALMESRAQPEAGVQLLGQFRSLAKTLDVLRRGESLRGAQLSLLDEVLSILGGIPLEAGAKPVAVGSALARWVRKLWPGPVDEEEAGEKSNALVVYDASRQPGSKRDWREESANRSLLEALEQLSRALGERYPEVRAKIGETVAELLFAQLANGGLQEAASHADGMGAAVIPLLFGLGAGQTGEGSLVVRADEEEAEGESEMPKGGGRFLLNLPTQTMGVVQVALHVSGDDLSVTLCAQDEDAVDLLARHAEELRGRLGMLPFRLQACDAVKVTRLVSDPFETLGLQELVHFDRRV
jgi:hypothetical protein